jgi:hypothetical protein
MTVHMPVGLTEILFSRYFQNFREYLYLPLERRGYSVEKARSRDIFMGGPRSHMGERCSHWLMLPAECYGYYGIPKSNRLFSC